MDDYSGSVKRASYLLVLAFFIVAATVIAGGFLSYDHFSQQHRSQEEEQLTSITSLKISELVEWREGCLRSAGVFYRNPAFASLVKAYFDNPGNGDAAAPILSWMDKVREGSSFDRISLLDRYGRTCLAVPDATASVSALVEAQAREALKTGSVDFVDFYRNEFDGSVYLSVLVPVHGASPGEGVQGVVSLRIDPEKYLYPYINQWPVPSRTAETLLVRREGGKALFLNELRFQKHTALTLKIPLPDETRPAARAVKGYTGIMQGTDYRGRRVLADVRPVPGSPWFLVARVDMDEVDAPMRARLWLVVVLAAVLLVAAGSALGLVWRQQLVRFYRERLEKEQALRKTEAALMEQFSFLQQILDTIPLPVFYKDAHGRYLGCNKAFEANQGVKREELLGRTVFDLAPRELAEKYDEADRALLGNPGGQVYESGVRYADGQKREVVFSKATYHGADGEVAGIVGCYMDITDRKTAEEALQESEMRVRKKLAAILEPEGDITGLELKDILDHEAVQSLMDDFHRLTGIGIGIIDLEGRVLVGTGWQDICTKFHRVHPETRKNCIESDLSLSAGVAPGEFKIYRCKNNMWDIATPIVVGGAHLGNLFLGQFFFEDEAPDAVLFMLQARQHGFDEGEYLAALERVPRFSRETIDAVMGFYAKFSGMISRLSHGNLRLARTLRERDSLLDSLRKSEQVLLLERNNLMGILDAFNDGVYIVSRDYRIEYVNPVIERLFGPVGEKRCHEYFHKLSAPCAWCKNDEVNAGRSVTWEWESKAAGKVYELFDAPFKNPDGSVSKIEFFHDITDRKKFEEELREKNTELERFTYMISHDLKSPLVTVKTFLGYLDQDMDKGDRERIESDMHYMRTATDRMSRLLDELLEMSRVGRMLNPPAAFTFREVAEEAASLVAGRISQRGVAVTIGVEDVQLFGDRVRLSEIWQNLVENAVKFMGGQEAPAIVIGADIEGGTPVFYVEDNGMGIEPGYQEKIFGLFEKLDASCEGTGLGLALAKRIVELHRGSIRVLSRGRGEGSRFEFTLPAAARGSGEVSAGAEKGETA